MRRSTAAAAILLLAIAAPAEADDPVGEQVPDHVAEQVAAAMRDGMGEGWLFRVRRQEETLVAFVTPPVAEGWNVANQAQARRAMAKAVCATVGGDLRDEVPSGGVLVVPVILGKALTHLRESCPGVSDAS